MDKILEKVNEAAMEVFGTMYFMPLQILQQPPAEGSWHLDSSYICAEIGFAGPLNADVTFYFPLAMVKNITEGFLGIDPGEITNRQMEDTMKEAANMTIGCFLGKVDPEGLSKLGIPSASVLLDFSPAAIKEEEMFIFESEFGYLWMRYVETN